MTIPEDVITTHLDLILSRSVPGDALHHFSVIAAPLDRVGALGLIDPDRLHVTIYAIAADRQAGETVEQFIQKVVATAGIAAHKAGMRPVFAALGQECWTAPMDELGRRLHREGSLADHPDMVEATMVYAAASDGRRWRGRRWLTGPQAGTTQDVDMLVGRPHRGEEHGVTGAVLIRKLVGLAA